MYTCPGDRCSWDTFTTLGVCSEHQNVTDNVVTNCTGRIEDSLNCTYTFPSSPPLQPYAADPFIMQFAEQSGPTSRSTTLFQSTGYIGEERNTSFGAVLYTARAAVNDVGDTTLGTPPATDLSYTAWYWCSQTLYNLTATPHAIAAATTTYERLVYNTTSDEQDGNLERFTTYIAPSTGARFNIDSNADRSLFNYISKLLTRQVVDAYPHAGTTFDADSLDLSTFLYTADIGGAAASLAATLTGQVRSAGPGDNANATMLAGDVHVGEAYISVDWPWLALPAAETLLVAALLGVSVALTWGQPLLKNSLIALLVHGLRGWAKGDLAVPGREDAEKLGHLAEGLRVRLLDDGDEGLHFMRV